MNDENAEKLKQAEYALEDAEIDVSNLRKAKRLAYEIVDMSIAKDLPAAKAELAAANVKLRKAEVVAKQKKRALGKTKLAAYHEMRI